VSKVNDKRWAILPPPSVTSAALSGQFTTQLEISRRRPARRVVVGEVVVADADRHTPDGQLAPIIESGVNELEPADSEKITEVPPHSRQRFSDSNLETIPAPAWRDED
jgi:hypothetical protein